MTINPQDVAALSLMLSPERLGPLMAVTGSVETAIELHQETLRLGASLMNVTATVEIALRNSVCKNLSHHFTTAHGRLMLTVLGGPAEFECELIRARTGEGRERAKARGQHMGRPPKLTRTKGRRPSGGATRARKRLRKLAAATM